MSGGVRAQAALLAETITRTASEIGHVVRIMEVCGTHTVSLRRHGIHSLLPESVELISGPGCPVCVTPTGYIDNAIQLAESGRHVIATFGDMLKVPGSDGRTLSEVAGNGAVRMVYSPSQVHELAVVAAKGGRTVVFLAIGFETTIPTVLSSASIAAEHGEPILYYTAFKLVPPALKALLADADHGISGFLLPGHVSMIIGADAYGFLQDADVPGTITGFEPLEMLRGIAAVLLSIRDGEPRVTNEYPSVVKPAGNRKAQALIERMVEPADAAWRGLGTIRSSALRFRSAYERLDAAQMLSIDEDEVPDPPGCLCGSVIRWRAKPPQCRHFGDTCTPEHPVGPCMVSSEGTCAAHFRYATVSA